MLLPKTTSSLATWSNWKIFLYFYLFSLFSIIVIVITIYDLWLEKKWCNTVTEIGRMLSISAKKIEKNKNNELDR